MKSKIVVQALWATILMLALGASTVAAEEAKTLSAAEIKQAFIGNTMDHDRVYVFWQANGTITGKVKGRDITDTGKFKISVDGTYCRAWDNWRGGKEQCGKIGNSGDQYARIVDGEVQSQFKILRGNPEGL